MFDKLCKNNIKNIVILSDMDGTFLPASKIPSQKSLDAVKRFEMAGGRFSIATGRAMQASQKYFSVIPLSCPAILCNGGMVCDTKTGEGLMNVFTPEHTVEIVAKILQDNSSIGCEILTPDTVFVPQLNDTEKAHIQLCEIEPVYAPLEQIPKGEWYKVLFADTPDSIDRLEEYVKQKSFTGVDFVRSSESYYEILPLGISKGSAVEFIREKYCSPQDTIVCVGDYYNDSEMLSSADIAVCPSNAEVAVKSICDIVLESSCEESAIAELIDKIFDNQF